MSKLLDELLDEVLDEVLYDVSHFWAVFQTVELQSLWAEQPVVLFFLRRFGCQVCRWMASEISRLEPELRASGVALVGVGPEEFGLQEFRDGGFFSGCKQVQ